MPIRRCDCKADPRGNTAGAAFQDSQYGTGMRLWTDAGSKTKTYTSRCTVCGKSLAVKHQEEAEAKKQTKTEKAQPKTPEKEPEPKADVKRSKK